MVLVDYIGIFFTCGNTFGHILYKIFMKNVQFLRKVLPVNSEVLVHLKNFERPAGCMKPVHQALA